MVVHPCNYTKIHWLYTIKNDIYEATKSMGLQEVTIAHLC